MHKHRSNFYTAKWGMNWPASTIIPLQLARQKVPNQFHPLNQQCVWFESLFFCLKILSPPCFFSSFCYFSILHLLGCENCKGSFLHRNLCLLVGGPFFYGLLQPILKRKEAYNKTRKSYNTFLENVTTNNFKYQLEYHLFNIYEIHLFKIGFLNMTSSLPPL